jgi:hypothetical protein
MIGRLVPFLNESSVSQWTYRLVFSNVLFFLANVSTAARATSDPSIEERFQDLFVTAGYCTAFGAALGTAMLAWTSEPAENLRYVAVGASMGFIGGSVLGTYVVFSPLVVDSRSGGGRRPDLLASHKNPGFSLQPIWDEGKHTLTGLAGSVTFATF